MATSSRPMAIEPTRVPPWVAGDHGERQAGEGEEQADHGADVLQQHDGQLRLTWIVRMNRHHDSHPGLRTWFASLTAVRSDNVSSAIGDAEDDEGDDRRCSTSCGWSSFSMPS